jgi:hypothetical protein
LASFDMGPIDELGRKSIKSRPGGDSESLHWSA